MGFANPATGDVVQAWAVILPTGFRQRLETDFEGLRREAEEAVTAARGYLIDAHCTTLDGRPAFSRTALLPSYGIPDALCVLAVVAPVYDTLGLEITITCSKLTYQGAYPHRRHAPR